MRHNGLIWEVSDQHLVIFFLFLKKIITVFFSLLILPLNLPALGFFPSHTIDTPSLETWAFSDFCDGRFWHFIPLKYTNQFFH